jgi:phthiocerol/phenolphthiocerol synthesis type-I polyketide synthase E
MSATDALSHSYGSAIAIIGLACRFPDAEDADEFWKNLRDGVESISFFSDEELLCSGVDSSVFNHPRYVRAKGVLKHAEYFDAAFFGYSEREAEIMDPQQRVFLECAWQAIENAGYDPEGYEGLIGVYAGSSINTYAIRILQSSNDVAQRLGGMQVVLGSDKDFLTTRACYKLNLTGPGITVQTACSTSLVAVHLACQSLLTGECDIALAGGVSVSVPLKSGYVYQDGGIKSPDGHCRAFDARAQGIVGGNGVGVVALKRLTQALVDRDSIHAIIRGSAVNNDGSFKVGYTAPSIHGQAKVIAEALGVAGVEPESISYIEAHGTGTELGDPVEIAALTKVFQSTTNKKRFCAVGSVKTNMGHLDAASGIAGLIKTVLSLKNKMIPASLHFEEPNPQINFADSPFYVNRSLSDWQTKGEPRRAGVSSFGIGGTNAHLILEEAPATVVSGEGRPWKLLALSAKTESTLSKRVEGLIEYLKKNEDANLADVAYTLLIGRRQFNHRSFVLCRSVADAIEKLTGGEGNRISTVSKRGEQPQAVFVFPGQGTQHVNTALDLHEGDRDFKRELDRCSEYLKAILGIDLRSVLYPEAAQINYAIEELNKTYLAQPALFAVEYSLARMWMSWGVQPEIMIGHSVGEYVAACLAGVFSLEDALSLIAARCRLMQSLPRGKMLAVKLSEEEIWPHLGPGLSLAVINGVRQCVISGRTGAIQELEKRMNEQGVAYHALETSHAFHSDMVDPIVEDFVKQVSKVKLNEPKVPYISNVTGKIITPPEAIDPHYWGRHLRDTVRFSDGVKELLKGKQKVFIEVGPGQALTSLIRQQINRVERHQAWPTLRRAGGAQTDFEVLLNTAGKLWQAGANPDLKAYYANERRNRLPLPGYPFERKRYWIEREIEQTAATAAGENDSARLNEEEGAKAELAPRPGVPAPGSGTVAPAIDLPQSPHQNGTREEALEILAQQLEVISQQMDLLGDAELTYRE